MVGNDERAADTGARWRRLLPAGAATACFLVMAALYLLGFSSAYHTVFRAWGVASWPFPFLDTDTVLSAVRCVQQGVDVYVANPCDVLGRVYDYSPLWLVLVAFPGFGNALQPIGLSVDVGFLLALLLLPTGRRWTLTLLITAGTLSSAVAFAMERANNDLVLYTLASLAAALACRSLPVRSIGYACALLAGLLKYYPMTLMALADAGTS